jgi:cell division protease FtsH
LLYGPPGTGKTYLAEMFAKNEALAYVRVNFAVELIVGSSKIKQDRIFQQAKKIIEEKQKETLCKVTKPVVIIIDEIDAVGRKSFSPISSNGNEATDNLLINIDKIRQEKLNIVIIATTNYSSVLDPALIRTGRFGYQIQFSYPTEAEIDKMVEHCQEKVSSQSVDID